MHFPGTELPDFWQRDDIPASTVEALRAEVVREQRVAELLQVALKLAGDDDDAGRNVGAGLLMWLHHGGNLAKRLGVAGRRGSHRTACAIARRMQIPSSR